MLAPEEHARCVRTATAILGDKWTPLLIQALAEDPRRFCGLQDATGGINPRTLSARLDMLEEAGIISQVALPEQSPRMGYQLTAKGTDLLPILDAMTAWGAKYK